MARILIIDDEAALRRALVRVLRIGGHETIEASGADDALAILDQSPDFDVILTDLTMPGVDGLAFLALLRNKVGADFPVIAVSGNVHTESLVREVMDGGASDVLEKPFTLENVLAAVQNAIDRGSKERHA